MDGVAFAEDRVDVDEIPDFEVPGVRGQGRDAADGVPACGNGEGDRVVARVVVGEYVDCVVEHPAVEGPYDDCAVLWLGGRKGGYFGWNRGGLEYEGLVRAWEIARVW